MKARSTLVKAGLSILLFSICTPLAVAKTTVRLAFWGGTDDLKINTDAAKKFEQSHPDIKIKLEHIASDYDAKILTMTAAGTSPDVIQVAENVDVFASKGIIASLNAVLKRYKFENDDFYPKVLGAYMIKGNQYAIPYRWGPMSLYYNRTLFSQAGVTFPTDKWDWMDFVAAGMKLSAPQQRKFAFTATGNWWPWYMTGIYANGGRILKEDMITPALDEKAAEALEFWNRDLAWKYHVAPTPQESNAIGGGSPDPLFEKGKIAMNATGFWAVYNLRLLGSKAPQWDVAYLPKKAVHATPLFSTAWAISKQCKRIEAAYQVANYFAGREYAAVVARSGHDIPARRSIANSKDFLSANPDPKSIQSVLDYSAHIFMPPATMNWSHLQDAFAPAIDKLNNNRIDGRAAIKIVSDNITKTFFKKK